MAVDAWAQEPVRFTGSGSWVQAQRFSWSMWYPWPPFHEDYTNEPGVHVHFAQADIGGVVTSIEEVLATAVSVMAAALGPVGPVFFAFAGIVGVIAEHLAINNDGSVDIYMSAHGSERNRIQRPCVADAGEPSGQSSRVTSVPQGRAAPPECPEGDGGLTSN